MYKRCRLVPTAMLNEWAVKARSGCRESLERVLESVWPMILQWSGKACRNGESIDDLIQEGALAVFRAIDQYDPSRGAFTTYLGYALRTMYHRHHRRMSPLMALPLSVSDKLRAYYLRTIEQIKQTREICQLINSREEMPSAGDELESPLVVVENQRQAFEAYLETCPPIDRQVLEGRRDGLTLKEIGAILGRSKERVRQYEARAIKRARWMLAGVF